ncbi:glutamate racemase [Spirochaetia bacterium]|nr:glutamate racemase [Spirochaetia bacterium]
MIKPILFLDSGAGGLPYYRDFHIRNPAEKLVYAADRENFPYGAKDPSLLISLLTALMEKLINRFDPRLVVLACNTASVTALDHLRSSFSPLPFVGTVPAIKPAAEGSRRRSIGLLGTARTVEDPYIADLAARYAGGCSLSALAAPDLVDFVERRLEDADEAERLAAVKPYVEKFRAGGADAVVLGCTHFLLLADEFRLAASPDIKIYDSIEGISRRIENLSNERAADDSSDAAFAIEKNLLVLTGSAPPEKVWEKRARRFDLSLCLLNAVKPETSP